MFTFKKTTDDSKTIEKSTKFLEIFFDFDKMSEKAKERLLFDAVENYATKNVIKSLLILIKNKIKNIDWQVSLENFIIDIH